jgi:hypothetical protein
MEGSKRTDAKKNRERDKLTRRLNPETVAREVAIAAEESGSTPGRCPTTMLEDTCTPYCDSVTPTMGSAR